MAATRWPEAEAVFRDNQSSLNSADAVSLDYWRRGPMGTDIAACVQLPGKRWVWLFGDTWMPPGPGLKTVDAAGGGWVSNCMLLQEGNADPTKAKMSWWCKGTQGAPLAFWPKPTLPSTINPPTFAFTRYPFGGVHLPGADGGKLLIVGRHSESKATLPNNFGTTMNGGWACLMGNLSDRDPRNWTQTFLTVPGPNASFHVEDQYGFGSHPIIELDGNVYFPMQGPSRSDKWALARVDFDDLYGGSLANLEWWGGAHAWVKDSHPTNTGPGNIRRNVLGQVAIQGSDQPGGFHKRQRDGRWQWTGIPYDWKVRDDPAQGVGWALSSGPGSVLGAYTEEYVVPLETPSQFIYGGLFCPGIAWEGMPADGQVWVYSINGSQALTDPRAYCIKFLKVTEAG